jgi:hypothetical protein
VAKNFMAYFAMQQIYEDFNKARYIYHLTNTSNCNGMKQVTLLVRYFTPEKNMQIKIIDLKNPLVFC